VRKVLIPRASDAANPACPLFRSRELAAKVHRRPGRELDLSPLFIPSNNKSSADVVPSKGGIEFALNVVTILPPHPCPRREFIPHVPYVKAVQHSDTDEARDQVAIVKTVPTARKVRPLPAG